MNSASLARTWGTLLTLSWEKTLSVSPSLAEGEPSKSWDSLSAFRGLFYREASCKLHDDINIETSWIKMRHRASCLCVQVRQHRASCLCVELCLTCLYSAFLIERTPHLLVECSLTIRTLPLLLVECSLTRERSNKNSVLSSVARRVLSATEHSNKNSL